MRRKTEIILEKHKKAINNLKGAFQKNSDNQIQTINRATNFIKFLTEIKRR